MSNKQKKKKNRGFIVAVTAGIISSVLTLTLAPYSQEMNAEMEQKLEAISQKIELNKRLINLKGGENE